MADYHALKAAALERDSKSMELEALLAEATLRSTYTDQYDPQLGQALLQEALTLAESLEDRRAQSKIYWNLMLQGTYAKVKPQDIVAYGEQAAGHCPPG